MSKFLTLEKEGPTSESSSIRPFPKELTSRKEIVHGRRNFCLYPRISGIAEYGMFQALIQQGRRIGAVVAVVAMAVAATSIHAASFRTRWDPVFNVAFSGVVGQDVGWRGSADITVDSGCLVPSSIVNVGVGPCLAASLDGATLLFYDAVPANGIGGIAWAGALPAPSSLSIDAFGNVDGMDFAAAPLTALTDLWPPQTYAVSLDFTLVGPELTLQLLDDGPQPSYLSGQCEACQPAVTWSRVFEPTSLALVGIALVALALLRRRKP